MKYFMPSLALFISMNCSAETYTIGVEQADFLPHYGVDEQSSYQGFARDVLDMFAEHAGVTLVYKPLPVPDLPHVRSSFRLSSKTEPQVLAQFDEFLASRRADIEQLKNEYKIEDSINSEYFGLEQWKIDFLKRQKAKQQAEGS
ncbi:hypothetical protein [Marinobacter fuscus]